ncbi:MAG: tetratricopeptide repeat protein [Candidatus Muiribacteriota bacterium]
MFSIISYLINRKKIKKGCNDLNNGRYNNALKIFRFLKDEKKLDNFFINLNIGNALSGKKQYKEARFFFNKSLKQFSLNPVPLNGIAITYFHQKNYIFSYKYSKKALKIDPLHPYSNYYAALSLIGMNKPEFAGTYFEKVLAEKKELLFSRLATYFEKELSMETGIEPGEF